MTGLRRLLKTGARQRADGKVWVPGGWVEPTPTLPLESGVVALVRFATACWHKNLALQVELMKCQHAHPAAA